MSQLILDDQLDVREVLLPVRKWITARRLHDLRPNQIILDDRVPEILLSLKQPTFITIDQGFWEPHWANPNYCILYLAFRDDQQFLIPSLLRRLFRLSDFRTRAK